jgi:hypothetical protein
MLTKTVAQDEKWLITVTVHPGWVQTDLGGPSAPVKVRDSAKGIWRVINGLKASDTGQFLDFKGEKLPW